MAVCSVTYPESKNALFPERHVLKCSESTTDTGTGDHKHEFQQIKPNLPA